MTAKPRRWCSVSLDLDNKWSYLKTHGEPKWQELPSYLQLVVPRVLDLLDDLGMKITFFIVGQDAAQPNDAQVLHSIAEAGHEIGNHSFHHEPWLHRYSPEQLHEELGKAENAIAEATGQSTCGFRGPGFSVSPTLLRVLDERGYRYDASTFPTFLGPIARAYYFFTAKLTPEQREERKLLFGSPWAGFWPLRPFVWKELPSQLLEIPVTTMPVFKVPIHLSYVLYLAGYSKLLAWAYFRASMALCRLFRVRPSLLLHPLDFLGGDDEPDLDFFPAMQMTGEEKVAICRRVLGWFANNYEVLTMEEAAIREKNGKSVRKRSLSLLGKPESQVNFEESNDVAETSDYTEQKPTVTEAETLHDEAPL